MLASTSLNAILGQSALILGLVASLFGALVLGMAVRTGNRAVLRTAPRYAWLVLFAAVAAFIVMERGLITRDWGLAYVQKVGATSTPKLYNFAALWSALEGSILLWVLVLAGYTAAVMRKYRKRLDDPLVGWALVVMFAVSAFFFFLAFGPTDVFKTAGAPDFNQCCLGPNPLLQNHILVLFHPPILYLGFVGFTVPFAFAIAALITGRVGEGWLVDTRRWALFAWGFLTIGIILGGWWSYEVLGWGGVVGLGRGGERQPAAVAHRHRVHPLGDGPGAPRDAARLEHQPARGHVRPDHPRHVPHPQRGGRQRARVQRRRHRSVAARRVRRRRRRLARADRLAR